jgi:hypothetical protein
MTNHLILQLIFGVANQLNTAGAISEIEVTEKFDRVSNIGDSDSVEVFHLMSFVHT